MDEDRDGGDGRRAPAKRPARKPPRRVSAEYLERSALHYLERFASSTANLRRVLTRKVQLSARAHGTDPAEGAAWVDALLERFARSGLLNDKAYAEMKAVGLQRRGGSSRTIKQKLAAKGLDSGLIDEAMGELEGAGEGQADLAAAIAYARRRRIGPYRIDRGRSDEDLRARRDKELASMARAGFDLDTARRVLDAEDPDALLDQG